MTNREIRNDILKTMAVRIRQGNHQLEWDGFLSNPTTALALKELAKDDVLFGKFFAKLWMHFGARSVLPATLIPIKRLLNRQIWQAMNDTHKGKAIGLTTDLLLKFT